MAKKSSRTSTGPVTKRSAAIAGRKDFLVAGIGASAGGIEAIQELLKHLPTDTGIAFVIVQHLSPRHESKLPEVFSTATSMPIVSIKKDTSLAPNTVFVLAENRELQIEDGQLRVSPRKRTNDHLPINNFFQSLAHELGNRAIGIILSGNGTDGMLGLEEIKAEGGITFSQDEKTARFPAMPANAISAGCVDFILSPSLMSRELTRIGRHPGLKRGKISGPEAPLTESEADLNKIFSLLRALNGVDFSYYKHSTLKRRIVRRMVLKKIETIREYASYLQQNPSEVDALFQDLLINVTAFFRDEPMFQALKKKVFPRIIKQTSPQAPIRIWVPGCSTGEEVYSLAISLFEFLGKNAPTKQIQIFGTDISEAILAKARAGFYPDSISKEISTDRLRRYFHKTERGYQIAKFIRDCCVFALQNVVEDPPFSKLDLISCRNVLIYLGPVLQKKVMPIFHYALKKNGTLVLGGSETIGLFANLFTLSDKKNKVYLKRDTYHRPEVGFVAKTLPETGETAKPKAIVRKETGPVDLQRQVDRLLLSQYAPAGVVINSNMEVLHFRGQTGPYLEHAPGDASLSLPKMVRHELLVDLRTAISRAVKMDVVIRKENIPFHHNGKERQANLQVIPFRGGVSDRLFLIIFEEVPISEMKGGKGGGKARGDQGSDREALRLRDELNSTKESLQAIIEEQEATNEELKSANEEIQSSNEELQSTNEELETAKEELQSTNEELTTLNEELQNRNGELSQLNNDLSNLLSSVSMPILMLGNDLTIRRFTPLAERFFNLIPTDIGRRISDINPNIIVPNFDHLVAEVIDMLRIQEHEVQDKEGRWYSLRVRPYRTTENKIDGAVILLVDIDELRRGVDEITSLIRHPLVTLHGDLRVNKANGAFYKEFNLSPSEVDGRLIYDLGDGQWNLPALRTLLEGVLPENNRVEDFVIESEFSNRERRKLLCSARRIYQQSKGTQLILLAIDVVS